MPKLAIRSIPQIIKDIQHPDEKGTGAASGIDDGESFQAPIKGIPEIHSLKFLICISFLLRLKGENGFIESGFMFLSQVIRQVVHQREAAHQVDFCARRVEYAGIAAFIGFLRDVDEAFIHFSDHLRIDGDLLIERAIFRYGEVEIFEEIENCFEAGIGDFGIHVGCRGRSR